MAIDRQYVQWRGCVLQMRWVGAVVGALLLIQDAPTCDSQLHPSLPYTIPLPRPLYGTPLYISSMSALNLFWISKRFSFIASVSRPFAGVQGSG
jgi:hypothetical protein